MKFTTVRATGLTALFGILAGVVVLPHALAQDRSDRPSNLIEQLDSDNDGRVSAEEFLSRVSPRADTLFERRDRNLDGVLTQDEQQSRRRAEAPERKRPRDQARRERGREALTACIQQSIPDYTAPARPGRDGGVPAFDTMDADQNGSLTLAEVTTALENRALARFNELDTNSDGFITQEDVDALQQARQNLRTTARNCAAQLGPR